LKFSRERFTIADERGEKGELGESKPNRAEG
jgi:hypothetical protein